MAKKITENDFIVVETNAELQAFGSVKDTVFKTKKFGNIAFSLFSGLFFDRWYELAGAALVEFAEKHGDDEIEPSAKKSKLKKERKRRKLLRARPMCPETMLEFYELKDHAAIGYIRHPELSFMSLFARPGEKSLVFDFKKGFFCYNVFYKNSASDVTALTNSEFFLLKFVENSLKKKNVFEKIDEKFDTFFVLGACDVVELLSFYAENFYRVFVFTNSRSYATTLFHFFFDDPSFVDVDVVDFFCREFQANENVHPLMRKNTDTGYVVSAVKVAG